MLHDEKTATTAPVVNADPQAGVWAKLQAGPDRSPNPKHTAMVAVERAEQAGNPHDIGPVDLQLYGVDLVESTAKPKPTMPALDVICRHYRLQPRRNLLLRTDEVWWQGKPHSEGLEWVTSVAGREGYSCRAVGAFLPALARRQAYHPVADWIQAAPWDGVDRMGDLLQTLNPTPVGIYATMVRKWMRGAAALACLPTPGPDQADLGCIMQGVLTLCGPGGCRKTSWIKALGPGSGWVGSEIQADNLGDKDQQTKVTTAWIVELAEVDKAVRWHDAETLKAFITRPVDEIRAPYAPRSERHYRRTAYAGTTNQVDGFLIDPTGNRRWWVVPVTSCDVTGLQALNLQQLWAQAWAEWQAAPAAHVLNGQESAENDALNLAHNRDRTPEEQALLDRFDPTAVTKLERYSATEVCRQLGLDLQRSTRAMGNALARHFVKVTVKGRVAYVMPKPKSVEDGPGRPNAW
jgi:hypothetical protein